MRDEYDVIVVGAGPAGCAAAYDLARARRRVLLVDRSAFPRVKPCAGAVTIKAVKALRYPIGPVVREIATTFAAGKREERRLHCGARHRRALQTLTYSTEPWESCTHPAKANLTVPNAAFYWGSNLKSRLKPPLGRQRFGRQTPSASDSGRAYSPAPCWPHH